MKNRKLGYILLVLSVCFLTACGGNQMKDSEKAVENAESTEITVPVETAEPTDESAQETEVPQLNSIEELETLVSTDVENTISALNEEYTNLIAENDTFEKYIENIETIEKFYADTYDRTNELCLRLRKYSIQYAELILETELSNDEKYDELDAIYDCLYEDMGDEIYDEIYDGMLEEMYEMFYDGILDDAYDTIEYKEWSDARSKEYKMWSNSRSDIYQEWSDTRSEIYEFWSDMRSELYRDDLEEAQEVLQKFKEDVAELEAKITGTELPSADKEIIPTSDAYDADDMESMLEYIEKRFESASLEVEEEATTILNKIGTSYDLYAENKEALSEFYANLNNNAEELYEEMQGLSVSYFTSVAAQGLDDYATWNGAMEDFYDVWDDGMSDYYDTWDECMGDLYDQCDENISNASDTLEYEVYSDAWSEMYDEYSDVWSEMYDAYSDSWRDIYDTYSDVWREFYDGNDNINDILGIEK